MPDKMPDVRIFVSGREAFGVPTGFGHAFAYNIFCYIPCLVVTPPRWVLQSSVESSVFWYFLHCWGPPVHIYLVLFIYVGPFEWLNSY